jgi:transcriptional regulator with XRE-family HTH domain
MLAAKASAEPRHSLHRPDLRTSNERCKEDRERSVRSLEGGTDMKRISQGIVVRPEPMLDPWLVTFGARLRHLAQLRGLKNRDIAAALDISTAKASRLLQGKVALAPTAISKLARVLGLPVHLLIGGAGLPRVPDGEVSPTPSSRFFTIPKAARSYTLDVDPPWNMRWSPFRRAVIKEVNQHRRTHRIMEVLPPAEGCEPGVFPDTVTILFDPNEPGELLRDIELLAKRGILKKPRRRPNSPPYASLPLKGLYAKEWFSQDEKVLVSIGPKYSSPFCRVNIASVLEAEDLPLIFKRVVRDHAKGRLQDLSRSRTDIAMAVARPWEYLGVDWLGANRRKDEVYARRPAKDGSYQMGGYTKLGPRDEPSLVAYSKDRDVTQIERRLYKVGTLGDMATIDPELEKVGLYDLDPRPWLDPDITAAVQEVRNNVWTLERRYPPLARLLRVEHDPLHPLLLFDRTWEQGLWLMARALGISPRHLGLAV